MATFIAWNNVMVLDIGEMKGKMRGGRLKKDIGGYPYISLLRVININVN